MIVAFEGVDASGKKTQTALLQHRFKAVGAYAETQDFPDYESLTGRLIGALLREEWRVEGPDSAYVRAVVMQSLMTTNRLEGAQHLRPFQGSSSWHMILDRYYASGLVYGQADSLPLDWLIRIHQVLPQPDLWIFIDVSPEESLKRRPDRRDEYERRPGLMAKVRGLYSDLFRQAPGIPDLAESRGQPVRWRVVDGDRSKDEVAEQILEHIRSHPLAPVGI